MKFVIGWIFGLNFGFAVSVNWTGNWAFKCDFKGNDIGNAQVRGEDCTNKCIATSGCTHFTWTTYNGGTCWMKGGSVTKADAFDTGDQSMVCGVLDSSGGSITWNGDWANACDFHGGDIGSKTVTSENCGGACAAYSGCTHFAWTKYNGGTCWLKGGSVSKADAFYTGDMGMVCGVVSSSPGTNARGVFVPWPKRVFGIYILLADEGASGFSSNSNWSPILYPYQQNGANVLFFSFINPLTMIVPPSYANLAKTRGTGQAGAVPANTVIMFAIGGYGYSLDPYNPWPWLESQASAEAMAAKVATWPNLYKCDGIDLDLEEGAGDRPNAGQNMVYFIKKLRQLVPNMIISQPTYGYPKVPAENYVINQSWDANGNSKNLADSIGLMTYEGATSLDYAKYYVSGPEYGRDITCRAPKNTIIVGASGSVSPSDLQTLVNGVNSNNYRGIMVWFGSVQNGFAYGADDATKYPQNQQAMINAKNNFASQN